MTRRTGVVTIAHGRHEHLALQHRSLAAGGRQPDRYVVVAMDDPAIGPAAVGGLDREVLRLDAPPDGLPLAAARNLGVDHLLQQDCDTVVVLDVDCLAGANLVRAYAEVAERPDPVVWMGPVTYLAPPGPGGYDLALLGALDSPHPARPVPRHGEVRREPRTELFWSLSFAVSASTWRRSGGFCEEYVGYGGEDTDFGRSAESRGVGLAWTGSARAYHQHHPVTDPPVEHAADVVRNATLHHRRWGRWCMTDWLEQLAERGLVRREGDGWAVVPEVRPR